MKSYNNYIYSKYKTELPINEAQFFIKNGSSLDSLFAKMESYNQHMATNDFVFESQASTYDIALTLDESVAARDLLVMTLEAYAKQLLIEAGVIDENEINEGISDWIQAAKDTSAKMWDKAKAGMDWVKTKMKVLWEFIQKVKDNAFKTIKDVTYSIVEMMCKLGAKLGDIMEKLKVETKQAQGALLAKIKEAFKKKEVKTNIYETLGSLYESNLEDANAYIINEWSLFGKKKEENNSESDNKSGNEYDKAKDAKAGSDSSDNSWGGVLGKAIILTLIQLFAYSFVCVLMPAIITLIAGPLAGAIAESLAKILWSSGVVFYQIQHEIKLHKSGDFDKKYTTKFKKAIHYIFFFLNIAWAAWKAISGIMEMGKIIDTMANGDVASILPSEAVQKLAGKLNDVWKTLSGSNASGWEKMQENIDKMQEQIIEEFQKLGKSAEEANQAFSELGFKNSMKAIKAMQDQGISAEQVQQLAGNDSVTVIMNGFFDPSKNEWSKRLADAWKAYGGDPEKLNEIMKQGSNAVLHGVNRNAGSMAAGEFPADFIQHCMKNNIDLGHGGLCSFMGVLKSVTRVIPGIDRVQNHFDWFGGFFALPSFATAKENNWFLLRVGSGKTGAAIYDIQRVEEYTYGEAEDKFKDLNPALFADMRKIIEANNKMVQNSATEVKEGKEDESSKKSDKEIVDDKLELLKKTEKGKNVLILFGKPYKKSKKKEESTKESLYDYDVDLINEDVENTNKESDELIPVAVFNSLLMCAGDLVKGRNDKTKKIRQHAIYYKGLQGGYEILPKDGGMSESDIKKWLGELLKASFMACYNINPVPPCYKKFGKWKINDKAPSGEREDFGNFTNEELLEIAQGNADIAKYFGSELYNSRHKGGTHKTLEQTDTKFAKEQHDKAMKRMATDMKSKKVQAVLDKYPNLKKRLMTDDGEVNTEELEKIGNSVQRIEKSFDKGTKKKGLWARIKAFFTGEDDDNNMNDYKPEEIRDLSYALHSEAANRKKKKNVDESNEEEYNEFDFCNYSIFEIANLNEFIEWWQSNDDRIFESNDEIKPVYNSLSSYIKLKGINKI